MNDASAADGKAVLNADSAATVEAAADVAPVAVEVAANAASAAVLLLLLPLKLLLMLPPLRLKLL